MPAMVVNPRTLFKYGVDNAYGGGESTFLDIINATRGCGGWPWT
jgi:S-adenosylhomocysteine hydrolase